MFPSLTRRDLFLALTVSLVWGVNFVVAKIGLHYFAPLFLTALRFLMVTIVLLPFCTKPSIPLKKAFIISVMYGVGYHALLFTGVWKGLDIPTSIIAVQLNVPFTSLLGVLFLQDRLGWRRIAGMFIAFTGIVIIVGSPTVLGNPFAFLLALAAALCWAIFNIQLKQLGKTPIFSFLFWVSLFSTPQLFLLSWLLEPPQLPALMQISWVPLGSIAYMALLSTILGFGLWFRLLHRYSVHQIVPFSMLMPVFGIISAILMLDEPLTWHIALGGIITLSGVAIIVLRRPVIIVEGAIAT